MIDVKEIANEIFQKLGVSPERFVREISDYITQVHKEGMKKAYLDAERIASNAAMTKPFAAICSDTLHKIAARRKEVCGE